MCTTYKNEILALEDQSDEALCLLAASGNRMAEETLVARYNRLVRTCARPFFLAGGDSEDLTQEGMVGLITAVREYNSEKETSFRTFAEICIRSRLYSVIRADRRDKQQPLNQSVSLDTPYFEFESNSIASGTSNLAQRNPEDFLIDREHTAALLSGVRKQLSEFEARILGYYLDGLSCREIAKAVNKPPKSVDNAVQRIRRKVARHLLSGDFSRC
ncbi:MAG: sigma-70 family RNA polymerase sigma factor [Oscillibacter sp.]|jgi:RNA polymerase sporulation-specific sigma factor|uniref:sigma-70 family RNA polymerase sigma factor n=1 Tax=uncultured Oscillibacter sp. TaxID=876091 RepID=UPI0021748761|nr:sigma-70 family RNA polymerase sigma factor [uncultured Oscillibacter sp.]MCI8802693.1 sigma-70 family RNA polymerase sigma factor [Oscillibacter sp.]